MFKKLDVMVIIITVVLALSGCSLMDQDIADANVIIKDTLKSPSSFHFIDGKVVWKGKTNNGHPAAVVHIEYDAQNSFGATIRDCKLVALYRDEKQFHWDEKTAMSDCRTLSTEEATITAMVKINFPT